MSDRSSSWTRSHGHSPSHSSSPTMRPSSVLRPPPLAASMIHSSASIPQRSQSPRERVSSTSTTPNMASLTRQQRSIERNLQALLDAQADALIAGLSGPFDPTTTDTSATSSPSIPPKSIHTSSAHLSTSTIHTTAKAIPVRQPNPPQPPSLRAARREIWDAMRALTALKSTEAAALATALTHHTSTLAQLDAWAAKRAGLTASLAAAAADDADARDSPDGRTAPQLREDEAALDEQIAALEAQLEELRYRKRSVARELRSVENRVQARLSSFRGALGDVERDVARFLRAAPQRGVSLASGRTLEGAREEAEAEKAEVEGRVAEAEAERQALEEGAVVWNDTVGEISEFERALARRIKMLARGPAGSEGSEDGKSVEAGEEELLALMDDTMASVESKLKLAESRGWNLLVVAIGAELDAFRQGREILFGAVAGRNRSTSPAVEGASSRTEGEATDLESDGTQKKEEDKADLEEHGTTNSRHVSPGKKPRPHQDDPDPDLLISG